MKSMMEWNRELMSYTSGKVGLALFIFFIVMSIYALMVMPPNYKYAWNDPKHWQGYPQLAPPSWVRMLGYQNAAHESQTFTAPTSVIVRSGYKVYTFSMLYNLDVKDYPQDIVVAIQGLKVYRMGNRTIPVLIQVDVRRPDGKVLAAVKYVEYFNNVNGTKAYVKLPLTRSADRNLIIDEVESKILNTSNVLLKTPIAVSYLFSSFKILSNNSVLFQPLEGPYVISLNFYYPVNTPYVSPVDKATLTVVGDCYGLMGTDNIGRDLAQGLLYGFPIALAIGFGTALASTFIGLLVGAVSAYYGGWVDESLQRLVDIIGNVPLLPFLILLVDITPVGERLQMIMLVLVIFGWGGLAIVIRSMGLSIKEEPYIDAAKAIGLSNAKIIFKHLIPQVMPYVVASLVFSVPGAILSEAGLSVLGLEHGWPTWGRILADARMAGRYDIWWWILPPGFLLALTSLTFVLLGMAIETIVEPRLRTL